jgi:hypothetical protein
MSRPRLTVGAVVALAVAAVLAPIGPSTARAGGGLVTVMDATYDVRPDAARVQVTLDAVSTSFERDAPEGPVYYAGLTINVPPGSSNVSATSDGEPLPITVTPGADAVQVDIGFSDQVFLGDSYAYQVRFDMVDTGGAADRDFRIGHSVVAFPVWAFGTPEGQGSSVAVALPPNFTPDVFGGPMTATTSTDGSVQLTAEVPDPHTWFAYVTAERPGIFTESPFSLDVGGTEATIVIRAWDDDPEWASRTQSLMQQGIPVLHELIGLPWPVVGDLRVEESANRLGDYAGIYNQVTEKINVRYDADATVTLHEAAHIWFNDDLFRERWIGEAWAEFYAVQSAAAVGVSGDTFELTDDLLAARIPLNDWAPIGAETDAVEVFAYTAAYHVAQLIFERTDLDGLRAVWRGVADAEMAYQPVHATDAPRTGVASSLDGWQRLLDLLEERTGAEYTDLWSEWVVDTEDAELLAARSEARARYAEMVTAAGEWELPELVRYDLGSWQFADVMAELDTVDRILVLAADLETLAADLDLVPPDQLQQTFEGNGGLELALTEANKELLALEAIDDATTGLASEPDAVEWVGLLFSEPAVDLAAARDAWEAGEHSIASDHAGAVLTTLDQADDRGRERLAIGGGVLLLAGGGAALAVYRRRAPSDSEPGDSEPTPPADDRVEEAA